MKKLDLTNIKRDLSIFGLKVKKHSPELLAAGGTACVITGTVLACKSTLKINEVLEEPKQTIEKIHGVIDGTIAIAEDKEYTEIDAQQDLTKVYIQTGIKLGKLYLPSIVFTTVGLGMLVGSTYILHKRNLALGTALAATTTLFNEYRGRVIERFDEQTDFELYNNIKVEEIETKVVNEDGSVETVKEKVNIKYGSANETSVCFDETNPYWKRDAVANRTFLILREADANRILKERGYLFLNDVLKMLGFKETQFGHDHGWVYKKDSPLGDQQISIGIFEACNPNQDFIKGYEQSTWLNFNIDGNIYHQVW